MKKKAKERRNLERLKPYYYLRVYNFDSDEYIGSVSDISPRGMRIVSIVEYEKGKRNKFKLHLPEESILGSTIVIEGRCRWTKPGEEDKTFESGFEFVGQVASGIYAVQALIKDLKKNSLL